MRQCLDFALSLIRQDNETALTRWLNDVLCQHGHYTGILTCLLDVSGRILHCLGRINRQPVELTLDVADFTHPLAGVLHSGQPALWDSLHGGARTENPSFRQLLATSGSQCGLYALPVTDDQQRLVGVLALLDNAGTLRHSQHDPALPAVLTLFACQLVRLRQLASSCSEKTMLSQSLQHITDQNEQQRLKQRFLENSLVGQSAAMDLLRQKILQLAAHNLSVLIEGETGTGKDSVARLLHQCSARAAAPFVVVDCAAIPEPLTETELFGYQQGAFAGASHSKTGLLAQAHGGTLYLDNADNMPATMQAALLRVLETRHYRPPGDSREHYTDFRLIVAACSPISQQVTAGYFRQDLYHRIAQCRIHTPPLREHSEDIAPLCRHFAASISRQRNTPVLALHTDFIASLLNHPFPGNVRELKNLLEVACAHSPAGGKITAALLPDSLRQHSDNLKMADSDPWQHIHDLRLATRQYEQHIILSRLHHCRGDRQMAAKSLNIPRRTLDHKCRRLEDQP